MDTTWALAVIAGIVLGFPFIFTVEVGICDLPVEAGSCSTYVHRYYYDNELGTCSRFLYGGCGGNANRFITLKDCENACKSGSTCDLPPVIGACSNYEQRYRYDNVTGMCKIFAYSGCGGNANSFATRVDCQRACKPAGICGLPPLTGPCKMLTKRYYYDNETTTCKLFTYGGCNGNANRFSSMEDCESTCKPVTICDLPQVIGTCKTFMQRYYYEKRLGSCYKFTYSGCEGNANNFISKEDCESACKTDNGHTPT